MKRGIQGSGFPPLLFLALPFTGCEQSAKDTSGYLRMSERAAIEGEREQ